MVDFRTMILNEYLRQESEIREGVHFHDNVWWKRTAFGCCQPLYQLQELIPEQARPSYLKSFVRYSHIAPPGVGGPGSRTRMLIEEARLRDYTPQLLDRKRRQAINRALRSGLTTEKIEDLSKYEADLFEMYVSTAKRNLHGLTENWYFENRGRWWRELMLENSLQHRDWFGVFSRKKLIGFLYACQVEETAVWLATKSNSEYLKNDPNDLLWFDVISYYKNVENCSRIDAGWAIIEPETIDWRKRSLGFVDTKVSIFEKERNAAMFLVRWALRLGIPMLKLVDSGGNRGLLYQAKNIQNRLVNRD